MTCCPSLFGPDAVRFYKGGPQPDRKGQQPKNRWWQRFRCSGCGRAWREAA